MNSRQFFSVTLAVTLAGLLFSGCSTVVNSHRQKAALMEDFMKGDREGALSEVRAKLKEPCWYNSSVINTGDELVWRLEAGSLLFGMGKYQDAVNEFRIGEKLIADYDDRAKVSVRDVGAESAVMLTNLNALPYRGWCRDRIMLAAMKSLAYLGTGNESAFRAQLRRLRTEQKHVQEVYQDTIEKEKAGMSELKKEYPEQTAKAGDVTEKAITGDKRNKEVAESLAVSRKTARRGYGNFLNPMALFLSGLGSLRDGNFSNAAIDFRRLHEALPEQMLYRQLYVSSLQLAGQTVPFALCGIGNLGFSPDRNCVYVLIGTGRGPALEQKDLYFPVMTAWPVCKFYPDTVKTLCVTANQKNITPVLLADMDGILAQEFHERLPGMITRIVLSTLVKEGLYYGGITAVGVSNISTTAKVLGIVSIAVGGAIYRASVNTADTRCWETLPKKYHLAILPMPKDRTVTLRINSFSRQFRIPRAARSAIILADAPEPKNIAVQILNLTHQ